MKYKVYVTHSTPQLHPVFSAKLRKYGFQRLEQGTYYLPKEVDNLAAVTFYQKMIEGPQNPLKVSLKKA